MIAITTYIRLAKSTDLLLAPGLLKFGQPYFIKHLKTCEISGPYIIDKYHNSKTLETYYKSKNIYVPVIDFDFDIVNNLQQQDFKIKREIEEYNKNSIEIKK